MTRTIKKSIAFSMTVIMLFSLTATQLLFNTSASDSSNSTVTRLAENIYNDAISVGNDSYLMIKDGYKYSITPGTTLTVINKDGNEKEFAPDFEFDGIYNPFTTMYYDFDVSFNNNPAILGVTKDGKEGLTDLNGNLFGNKMYDKVSYLNENIFAANEDELVKIIKMDGTVVTELGEALDYYIGTDSVKSKEVFIINSMYIIDSEGNEIPYTNDDYEYTRFFLESEIVIRIDNHNYNYEESAVGYMDLSGNIIIEPFDNGWAYCYYSTETIHVCKYDEFGHGINSMYNAKGELLVSEEDGTWIMNYDKYGAKILDENRQINVVNFETKQLSFTPGYYDLTAAQKQTMTRSFYYSNSRFIIQTRDFTVGTLDTKVVDLDGNIAFESDDYYSDIIYFPEADTYRYSISGGSYCGLLDKNGKQISEIYRNIGYRNNVNLFETEQGGKTGLIDSKGKVIVEPKYNNIENFSSDGLALVYGEYQTYYGSGIGIITVEGNEILKIGNGASGRMVRKIGNGFVFVIENKRFFIIDRTGAIACELNDEYIPYNDSILVDGGICALTINNGYYGIIRIDIIRLKGDVNGSGDITIQDAIEIFRYLADKTELSSKAFEAANITGGTDVSIQDAIYIFRYLAGKINLDALQNVEVPTPAPNPQTGG